VPRLVWSVPNGIASRFASVTGNRPRVPERNDNSSGLIIDTRGRDVLLYETNKVRSRWIVNLFVAFQTRVVFREPLFDIAQYREVRIKKRKSIQVRFVERHNSRD
jgi:hypothetical protein